MMGATEVLGAHLRRDPRGGLPARRPRAHPGVDARRPAARRARAIVTGDTKVMGKGELDGIVLNTTGVGLTDRVGARLRAAAGRPDPRHRHDRRSRPRGAWRRATGCALEGELRSDVAPLNGLVRARARRRRRGRRGDEGSDPRRPRQRAARDGGQERRRRRARRARACRCAPRCAPPRELLGIDPLHVANEGKAVIGVRAGAAPSACSRRCARIRSAAHAAIVGTCHRRARRRA